MTHLPPVGVTKPSPLNNGVRWRPELYARLIYLVHDTLPHVGQRVQGLLDLVFSFGADKWHTLIGY